MHNLESVLENNTHKLLWNFDIQTDHLISVRRPDLVIINKKKRTCRIVDIVKLKESQRTETTVEHESDGDTNRNWCSWNSHQRISTRTGGLGNKRKSGDYPNYSLIEIGQNTEKNLGDLRKLTVTRTLL